MIKSSTFQNFLLSAFMLFPYFSWSQQSDYFHCYTDENRKKMITAHPELLQQEQAAEDSMHAWVAEYRKTHTEKSNQGEIIIPLVFHIVNEGGAENISDDQVRDEVRIMNRDYNKQNADTIEAVGDFPYIIANMGVTWRLANIDPNGNCTNGIDRINSDQTDAGDDYSKLNGWDRAKYVNVWVLRQFNLTPGAAGYAEFPGDVEDQYTTPWHDGVIIINSYIGSIGTSSTFTSRALTHEIGHCFNLEHTWGNTNNPGVSCGDDGVNDTPITKGYTSCSTPSDAMVCTPGVIENYQNYMEYSYCSVMFTEGQKERWIASANSSIAQRVNLWQDSNLIATGTYDTFVNPCAPIANFNISKRYICSGGSVQFLNSSGNSDDISYLWTFPNGAPDTSSAKNPVVQFSALGWQPVYLTAYNQYGSSTHSDSTLLFVGYDAAQAVAPYFEGFDDPNVFNEGQWISVNYEALNTYDDNITWFTQQSAGYHDGGGAAMLNNYNAHANQDVDEMVSPPLDLTLLTGSALNLSFYYSGATANSSYSGLIDSLSVQVSLNCGTSWVQIYKMGGATEENAGYVEGNFVPTQSAGYWQKVNVPLNANYAKPDVIFKFQAFTSVGGNNLYIDDFNVGNVPEAIDDIGDITSANIYPNPGDGNCTINVMLANAGKVNIKVYDMTGKEIMQVFDGMMSEGQTQLSMDGSMLAAGVYVVNIRAGKSVMEKKLVIK